MFGRLFSSLAAFATLVGLVSLVGGAARPATVTRIGPAISLPALHAYGRKITAGSTRRASRSLCPSCYEVSVVPDGEVTDTVMKNSNSNTVVFSVLNTGAFSDTYTLTCGRKLGVTCVSVNPTSLTIPAHADDDATVTFNVGSIGGTVSLTATSGAHFDEGSYSVVALPAGKPQVALRNANDDTRDHSLCLTSGAGEAAAWQCGDLLVSHGLPSYATLGRERALTFMYNSAEAVPMPLVAAAVTEGAGVFPATSVYAQLDVGTPATTRASATYTGWSGTKQVALSFVDTTDATGVYPYSLLIRNNYSTGTYDSTLTGNLILVQRRQGNLGVGWAPAGWERLWFNQPVGNPNGSILWASGVEAARVYARLDDSTWIAPLGAFRDTLRYTAQSHTYTRRLRHGITVTFDTVGNHIRTTNRTGQTTSFYYSTHAGAAGLDSIAVPPAGQPGTVYRFSYDGNGNLATAKTPDGRTTTTHVVNNRLASIYDPDGDSTLFGYDAAGRMTSRTTRRGFTTSFTYASGVRVTQVKVPLDPSSGDTATTVFQPWDEWGLAVGGTVQPARDTALAYTKIFGPRNVGDSAEFWVDRWGAPTKIVSPIGATTQLVRGDANVPALVTQATAANGAIARMNWNARGNLTSLRDSTYHLDSGATAVTRWTYGDVNTQDAPDSVIDPESVATRYAYNSWGLASDVTAPNGHVTHFDFVTTGSLTGLVRAVTEVSVPAWDTIAKAESTTNLRTLFGLDSLGNVVADTSPMGRVRLTTRDSTERVTNVYDPAGHRLEFVYDPLNRLLQSIQHADGLDLVTRQHFNVDVLDSIIDPRGVIRRYQYDAANRRTAEIDDYGNVETTYYNRAGLVDSVRPRYYSVTTGQVIRHSYDAAGRLLKKAWPARSPSAADSIVYTYDTLGHVLTATRSGRKIRRTYFADGTLSSEVQAFPDNSLPFTNFYAYDRAHRRTWYRVGTPGNISQSDSIAYRYDATTGALRWIGVRWRGSTSIGDSVRFAWDALGRRDSVKYRNGATVKFAYDGDGMMRLVCGTGPAGNPDHVFDFTSYHQSVDVDGMIGLTTNWSYGLSGCGMNQTLLDEQTNTYDGRHQLLTQHSLNFTASYTYDGSGNMLHRNVNTSGPLNGEDIMYYSPGHNDLDSTRRVATPNIGIDFVRDWNGARVEEWPAQDGHDYDQPGRRRYGYDGLGRTTGTSEYVGIDGGYNNHENWCRYDPVGRLWNPCDGDTDLGFDGDNVVRTGDDAAQQGQAWTFVHGPGTDDPVMGYNPYYAGGLHLYWITDGQGRQFAVGDSSGYDYSTDYRYADHGGKFAGGTHNASSFQAERYPNSQMASLSSFRNRFYDQATGRWTQEDPIGLAGGMNLFAYVGNNPVMFTDPFGLDCKSLQGARIPCSPLTGHLRLARLNGSQSTRGSGFVLRTRSDGSTYQHQGADVAAKSGSHVFAMYDGTVTQVTKADGNAAGTRITITSDADHRETTSYWHLSDTQVNLGDHVLGGMPIGHSGTTGNADPEVSGREEHLHVRTEVDGRDVDPGLP